MLTACAVDVVVAGGGIAGTSVAAALRGSGLEVVVVEPGLDRTKRLAGELIHPPGVTDLAALGLKDHLPPTSVMPVAGFAVSPDGDAAPYVLRYGEIPGLATHGFAIDHVDLAAGLAAALRSLPHVTVWSGARVTGVDLHHPDFAAVTVTRDGRETLVRARLLVAADGASSQTRALGGIDHRRIRISHMAGYLLRGIQVPHPGFASVFLGGPAPVLAYAIGGGGVRLMFDVPANRHGIDGAAPGHRVLPRAPRAVPERGEGGARPSASARVRELLDPARGGVPGSARPGRRRRAGAAIRSPPPASPRPPATPSTSSRRCARLPMCPRPCGATRRSERDPSARAWRSRSLSTGRSATRRPRCGSCAMGFSGSGAGVGRGARPRWRCSRPTRGGCR